MNLIDRLNRAFYEAAADRFSQSRSRPWRGWDLIAVPDEPTRVLDVGCGNGRLFPYLTQRTPAELDYWGIDFSPALLRRARQVASSARRAKDKVRFLEGNVMGTLPEGIFDRIFVFGLMHHIAGAARRRDIVGRLARKLSVGGELWVSFWQLGDDPRFKAKAKAPPLEAPEVDEEGVWLDFDGAGRRYCACISNEEIDTYRKAGVEEVKRFRADGKSGCLNLYVGFVSA